MNEKIKFDYVGTQSCGCRVTFFAKDDYKTEQLSSCKKHLMDAEQVKVIAKARENLNELLGRKE